MRRFAAFVREFSRAHNAAVYTPPVRGSMDEGVMVAQRYFYVVFVGWSGISLLLKLG